MTSTGVWTTTAIGLIGVMESIIKASQHTLSVQKVNEGAAYSSERQQDDNACKG